MWGTYRYYKKDQEGALIWKLLDPTPEPMYLIRDYSMNAWTVHESTVVTPYPYLLRHSKDGNYCPENSKQRNWMYYDHNKTELILDNTIKLTSMCEENI